MIAEILFVVAAVTLFYFVVSAAAKAFRVGTKILAFFALISLEKRLEKLS
ncbi:MAG: hypothetical protein HQM14_18115 [SAR324 cluster bacterium]|nr:hypothetical protein [SAR324 cluster bacterium]